MRVKYGDIWQLGKHRLMCGDSTLRKDVELLMNGRKADMVFTDPPYGVNLRGAKHGYIQGDLTQTVIPFSFELCVDYTTEKARFYFCGAESNIMMYYKLFDRYLAQMPKIIVWVKNHFVLKQVGYHTQYELIFYGFKPGAGGKDYWFSSRKGEDASDVWTIKKDAASEYVHPAQKPIELSARAVRNSTKEGNLVLDLFGGSGSTLIACERLNRVCYMMELDELYCDVIIKRWEAETGQKAERVREGEATETLIM